MDRQKVTDEQEQKQDMLLVAIYLLFQYHEKEEVSCSELALCLIELQKQFPLGYEFGENFPYYSYQLCEDLDDLWIEKRYLHRYSRGRREIVLIPRNCIALWPLGREQAKKATKTLSVESPEMIKALGKAIELAAEKYQNTLGSSVR